MSENRHITRIQDQWSNRTNLDNGQTMILTDSAYNYAHIWKYDGDYFFPAVSKSYDPNTTSWTYYDAEFDDVTAYGNVTVADDIIHSGDTDTKIGLADDQITITVGNVAELTLVEGASDYAQFGVNVGIGIAPSSALDVQAVGTAQATTDLLELTNSGNADNMDGTGTGILFNQFYYDAAAPAVADAGRIAVIAETDWTSTASTQDACMSLQTALNGTLTEQVKIASNGQVTITGNLVIGVGAAGVDHTITFNGEDSDGSITWLEDENYLRFDDYVAVQAPGVNGSCVPFIYIYCEANSTSMIGTGSSIDFYQKYYDGATGIFADAARIQVLTESNWTGTASTQDAAMVFSVANDGTVDERMRIASNGIVTMINNLTIGNGAAGVNYVLTFNGEDNDGVLTWMEDEDCFAFSDDILMNTTEKIFFNDTDVYIHCSTDGQVDIVADGKIRLRQIVEIGAGAAGVDYTLTFNGETTDGVLTWMEDEDYLAFSDDILMNTTERIYFRDTALYISSIDDGHLDLTADTSIDINGAAIFSSTIDAASLGAGEDDSVVVLDSDGKLRTDEIDSRVWGTSLVDAANGADNRIATFSDANSLNGEANLTFDGTTLTVTGSASVSTTLTAGAYVTTVVTAGAGGTELSPTEVNVAGKSHVELTPTANTQYYTFTGMVDNQVVYVRLTTSTYNPIYVCGYPFGTGASTLNAVMLYDGTDWQPCGIYG